MKKLSKDEMKLVVGGDGLEDQFGDDEGLACDPPTCKAKSNSIRGECSCSSHGKCLCIKV